MKKIIITICTFLTLFSTAVVVADPSSITLYNATSCMVIDDDTGTLADEARMPMHLQVVPAVTAYFFTNFNNEYTYANAIAPDSQGSAPLSPLRGISPPSDGIQMNYTKDPKAIGGTAADKNLVQDGNYLIQVVSTFWPGLWGKVFPHHLDTLPFNPCTQASADPANMTRKLVR